MAADEVGHGSIRDEELLPRIRAGDELAFEILVKRYHRSMTRLASSFVPSEAIAEEVAQETWIAILGGIERFEGRSMLKTWMFSILINKARTRGLKERRSVPFSSTLPEDCETGPTVDPSRFLDPAHMFAGYWSTPPFPWWAVPDERALQAETRALVQQAIEALPALQRQVVTLRDVEGWPAEEVCETLNLTEGNQRVLLHRGRARLRSVVEAHFVQVAQA
jgi:RNA polymerase sigma-70 factor (ECF subfamily)